MAFQGISLDIKEIRTKKQQELLKLLRDNKVKIHVNKIIGNKMNDFVPKKSGELRRSMQATPDRIRWGSGPAHAYAHYQYMGEVYGPNHPIVQNGTIVGWYSTPGMKKYPTGRELGIPGEWMGWRFGYTTPGTHHHWDRYFKYKSKLEANQEVTRYLKQECKRRGLKT